MEGVVVIRFGYSDVTQRDRKRVMAVVNSGQLSPGPVCREFETKFAEYYGVDHAVFVNSGTDALRIALLAMKERYGWRDGDRVAVPAITFPATINVVIQAGLTPFFVDVGMSDYNMNPWMLERQLGDNKVLKIKCALVAHLFGQQAEMQAFVRLSQRCGFRILEDSCETMGAGPVWGDVACFSTYQCHLMVTGVGGLAVTRDDDLHELMRSYANHGRDTAYLPGYRTPKATRDVLSRRFKFDRAGYSCRPTEMEAALGLGQLERLDENLKIRRRVAEKLMKRLDPLSGHLCLPYPVHPRVHNYMMFPVVIKETSRAKKEDLVWALEQGGVETRDMLPIINQPVFRKYITLDDTYSVAAFVNKNGFYVPCHPKMTDKDIGKIATILSKALAKARITVYI